MSIQMKQYPDTTELKGHVEQLVAYLEEVHAAGGTVTFSNEEYEITEVVIRTLFDNPDAFWKLVDKVLE